MNSTAESASVLMKLVEKDRAQRVDAIVQQAQEQARSLLRQARAEAARRVKAAAAEQRARVHREVAATRADLATRQRQTSHGVARTLVHRGWEQMLQLLLARWQDEGAQQRWIADALGLAQQVLPLGRWTVEHAAGPAPAVLQAMALRIEAVTGHAPDVHLAPESRAGLRITTHGAAVDATAAGLMCNRDAVEARLLMELSLEPALEAPHA